MDKEYIKRKFERVAELEEWILEAREEIKENQAALSAYFASLCQTEPEENRLKLARYMYWHTSTPQAIIGRLFGGMKKGTNKKAGPYPTGKNCTRCGAPLFWKDRTERSNDKGQDKLCRDCKAEALKTERTKIDQEVIESCQQQRQLVAAVKTMPYSEYLKTDHWQMLRKRALASAHYRCQVCNAKVPLDVHHRTYERLGHEYLSDMIALCRECHSKFHDDKGEKSVREEGIAYITDRATYPNQ